MSAGPAEGLARLLRRRRTAALGTLHAGAPSVSMVPYAIAPEGFLVHVSTLAAHTKDMLADSRVCLMVAEAEEGARTPQALQRVSVQGAARRIEPDSPELPACRSAYLARFPDSEPMFGFADFSLFLVRPVSARYVAGFGEAHTLAGDALIELLR